MQKRQSFFIGFLIIGLFLVSCQEQEIDNTSIEFDTSYFPVALGSEWNYDVVDIIIDEPIDKFDTSKYLMKEVAVEIIINQEGDSVYRIEQYRKLQQTDQWEFYQNVFAWVTERKAFRQVGNTVYFKINFPLNLGKFWHEHLYNREDTNNFFQTEVISLDEAYEINGTSLEKTSLLKSIDEESLISKQFYTERYAYGIGLVEKRIVDINSQDTDFSLPIEQRITTGRIYTQTLLP